MGEAHARRVAKLGDRVRRWDVQADALDAVVGEIRADGGEAEAVVADLTDGDSIDEARLQNMVLEHLEEDPDVTFKPGLE
jgi:NAD(P)-dependent dehydrogenase (short-subunit alcohol dehydrogenase family)